MKSEMQQLANQLWAARTRKDIESFLQNIEKSGIGIDYHPLGNRPNNAGTVEIPADPTLSSVERITNAIDSILELEVTRQQLYPDSPRDAAIQLLNMPPGGIREMSDKERRELASLIVVKLEDSGVKKKPTLSITDKGTGIEPQHFPKTILSLNEENKAAKKYLMGTYGQGGSQVYSYSPFTVIFSRRQPDLRTSNKDVIGWTIVQKMFRESQKTGSYLYLVRELDRGVFEFDADFLPEMNFGTRIVHIEYDLHGIAGVYTQDPYYFYNSAVFDPAIPFLLGGELPYRASSDTTGTRVIYGNATRLSSLGSTDGDILLAYENEHEIDLGLDSSGTKIGRITLKYWVLTYPDGVSKSGSPAQSYAKPDAAISVTLHGQRQGQESRYWISTQTKLGFIHKNLVVQVIGDNLSPKAKSELFAATRERVRASAIRDTIFSELAQRLRDDRELKRLDHLEKERLLQKSIGATSEKLKTRLNDYIKQRISQNQSTSSGEKGNDKENGKNKKDSVKKYPAVVPDEPRKTDDRNLPHTPTYIKFEKKQVTLEKGKQKPIWVEINAKNGFLQDNPESLRIIWPNPKTGKIEIKSKSKLLGGRTQWYLQAQPDTESGTFELSVSIETAIGEIKDKLIVTIVDPKTPEKTEEKTGGSSPNIEPRWVFQEEWKDWGENEFDKTVVGRVIETEESTIILLNRHYHRLNTALSAPGLTEKQIDIRADRYLFPVAVALYMQENEKKQIKDGDPVPSESFLLKSNDHMAEAVLAAIDSEIAVAGEMDREV